MSNIVRDQSRGNLVQNPQKLDKHAKKGTKKRRKKSEKMGVISAKKCFLAILVRFSDIFFTENRPSLHQFLPKPKKSSTTIDIFGKLKSEMSFVILGPK